MAQFGPFRLPAAQLFYSTQSVFATVNLRPVVKGHVLVCPKRVTARFTDLEPNEVQELFSAVHTVSRVVERHHGILGCVCG